MKYLAFLLTLILIFGLVLFNTVRYWPSGKLQDIGLLWAYESDIRIVMELAKQTEFKRVFWCKDREFMTVKFNDSNTEIRWRAETHKDKIFRELPNLDVPCFDIFESEGEWLGRAGYGGGTLEPNSQFDTRRLDISRFYSFGNINNYSKCEDTMFYETKYGICHLELFNGWYLLSQWITIEYNQET
ncbi:hypothetical protein [uncultured Paraglaciecola sp.]|uniref:hypothetical protein n=1 Tax=uncultured Paraglaciecola sp. TaxID=1765024 RepID=UPI002597EE8F|nr:hypothetical protein [uncultured Paraglaciecola sp.]